MSGPRPAFVADADIHALVDGRLEADRRADTLRRLAASPVARARVEAWQDQNDLLRSAFAGVEREPLPALLDLRAKSRLQCIPANDAPMVGPAPDDAPPVRLRRAVAITATVALICLGLGFSWTLLQADNATPIATTPIAGAPLRGTVDATLAGLATDALAHPAAVATVAGGASLPTTEIPDLQAAGFGFAGAEPAAEPGSILFRYQNGTDRLVVGVARAARPEAGPTDKTQTEPTRVGGAYIWHKRDKAFALAGTVRPARLRAIAVALLGKDTD